MTKEKLIQKVGRPILLPLSILHTIMFLLLIASVFICIWYSWDLGWRLGLTALFVGLMTTWAYKLVKEAIGEVVDAEIEKQTGNPTKSVTKSKWQERLEKMNQHQ